MELSWAGREPFTLDTGETRTFIEDNDTLALRGAAVIGQESRQEGRFTQRRMGRRACGIWPPRIWTDKRDLDTPDGTLPA